MAARVDRRHKIVAMADRHPWIVEHWAPVMVAAIIITFLMFAFERTPPVKFGSLVVTDGPGRAGHSVTVDWEQDWSKLCPGTVSRVIEGAHGETQPIRPFDIYPPAQVGPRHQFAKVYIPKTIGVGQATLRSTVRFRCNVFQELWPITVAAPPVTISVVEAAAD